MSRAEREGKKMSHAGPATSATPKTHAELVAEIMGRRREGQVFLVGIDGPGASGKSTLASGIAAASQLVDVVHMDDFCHPTAARYSGDLKLRPNGADFDRARLVREVLEPLRQGRGAVYHRYDWNTDAIEEATVSITRPIVVVEGVYALSAPLAPFYDFTIWVECSRETRLARGLARDGEGARSRWVDDWMLGEDQYMESERPSRRATIVCRGEGAADGIVILTKVESTA